MNTIQSLLQFPILERLGWALIHSIWQCGLAAVLLAVALPLLRRSSQQRYAAGWAALLLALLMPLVTFFVVAKSETGHTISAAQVATGSSVDQPLRAALPWAVLGWMCGVAVLSARHLGGWMSVQFMRRTALPLSRETGLAFTTHLMQKLGIGRSVIFAQSALLQVPAVIGWLKPLVLVPCSALTDLSPQYPESLVAHELAHIRRHDYLFNLIQSAVETLLFYHPAVWWISKSIRQERENCCDDIAVAVVGSARIYSEALAAMEELRALPAGLALAANGGVLLKRIKRLIRPEPARTTPVWSAIAMIAVLLGIAACCTQNRGKETAILLDGDKTATLQLTLERPPGQGGGQNWVYQGDSILTLDRGIPARADTPRMPTSGNLSGTGRVVHVGTLQIRGEPREFRGQILLDSQGGVTIAGNVDQEGRLETGTLSGVGTITFTPAAPATQPGAGSTAP